MGDMQLSPDAIKDFKAIYLKEYGVELSDEEAEDKAQRLLRFFRAVARALTNEQEPLETS